MRLHDGRLPSTWKALDNVRAHTRRRNVCQKGNVGCREGIYIGRHIALQAK